MTYLIFKNTICIYLNIVCTFNITLSYFNIIGIFKLKLISIFYARGIERPNTFLVKAGFTQYAANTLLKSLSTKIKEETT
jgi:hypothetical protein